MVIVVAVWLVKHCDGVGEFVFCVVIVVFSDSVADFAVDFISVDITVVVVDIVVDATFEADVIVVYVTVEGAV